MSGNRNKCAHGKWITAACAACKRSSRPRKRTTATQFSCSECLESFRDRDSLRKHTLRKHTDPSEWPIFCPGCEKKFACKSNAKSHILGQSYNSKSKAGGCPAFKDDESRDEAVVTTRQQHDAATQAANVTFVGPTFTFT
jgi:hypothetical protein